MRITWGLALEKMTSHGVLRLSWPVSQSLAQSGHDRFYGQDLEWFLALLSRGTGALRGKEDPQPHSTVLCPLPTTRSSLAEALPQPRKAALWEGSRAPPAEPSSGALVSVKRSCPSFQGSAGGGCPPQPSPEAPTHGGLTLAEHSELVNTLLATGDLHVSAPEAASHLLLHLRVDLLRVQLHLPLELLQRGVRLPCLQPLPLAHAGQLLLLLPGKATQATESAQNERTRFGQRTSFKSLWSTEQISVWSIQTL